MPDSPAHDQISQSHGLTFGICFSTDITALIWLTGDRLESFELRPNREVAFWYPWVSAAPTNWTRISVWGHFVSTTDTTSPGRQSTHSGITRSSARRAITPAITCSGCIQDRSLPLMNRLSRQLAPIARTTVQQQKRITT